MRLEELMDKDNNVVVNCQTKKESERILNMIDKAGYSLYKQLSENHWNLYKEKTCYNLVTGRFGTTTNYELDGKTIVYSNFITNRIVGFKLKKQYSTKQIKESVNGLGIKLDFEFIPHTDKDAIDHLDSIGLLDLWFKPITSIDASRGDWVVIENPGGAELSNAFTIGKAYQLAEDLDDDFEVVCDDNGKWNGYGKVGRLGMEFRFATEEEINEVRNFELPRVNGFEAKITIKPNNKKYISFGCIKLPIEMFIHEGTEISSIGINKYGIKLDSKKIKEIRKYIKHVEK